MASQVHSAIGEGTQDVRSQIDKHEQKVCGLLAGLSITSPHLQLVAVGPADFHVEIAGG
jgi:hypothetical protein